jgi:hypothetical protein
MNSAMKQMSDQSQRSKNMRYLALNQTSPTLARDCLVILKNHNEPTPTPVFQLQLFCVEDLKAFGCGSDGACISTKIWRAHFALEDRGDSDGSTRNHPVAFLLFDSLRSVCCHVHPHSTVGQRHFCCCDAKSVLLSPLQRHTFECERSRGF